MSAFVGSEPRPEDAAPYGIGGTSGIAASILGGLIACLMAFKRATFSGLTASGDVVTDGPRSPPIGVPGTGRFSPCTDPPLAPG